MNQNELDQSMHAVVFMAVQSLSDEQLISLNMCVTLDSSPRGRAFDYDTVKHLFDQDNGAKMHSETKRALRAVINQRLGANL